MRPGPKASTTQGRGGAAAPHAVEDEEDRRRRHVAEIGEHFARVAERSSASPIALAQASEDARTARDGPPRSRRLRCQRPYSPSQAFSQGRKCSSSNCGTWAKRHLKAMIADAQLIKSSYPELPPSAGPQAASLAAHRSGLPRPAPRRRRRTGRWPRSGRDPTDIDGAGCKVRRHTAARERQVHCGHRALATRRPFSAPWQPMKPTCVRVVSTGSLEAGLSEPNRNRARQSHCTRP